MWVNVTAEGQRERLRRERVESHNFINNTSFQKITQRKLKQFGLPYALSNNQEEFYIGLILKILFAIKLSLEEN